MVPHAPMRRCVLSTDDINVLAIISLQMMFVLFFLPFATAHIIESKVSYPITINGGEECIFQPLTPGSEMDVYIKPDTVVTVSNHYGILLGQFRVWDDQVHSRTVIDDDFMKSQKCEDIFKSNQCSEKNCARGKGWSMVQCAQTCKSCHLLSSEVRCNKTALGIGSMDGMTPGFADATKRRIMFNFKHLKPKIIEEEPLLMHFEEFMPIEDVEELLEYASNKAGLKRSTGQGSIDKNGVQEQSIIAGRTSKNAWCIGECQQLPAMKRMVRQITNMVGLPPTHFESAQILRYEEGQLYNEHNDMGDKDLTSLSGPRIYTIFVYLTDVENGGETEFPRLKHKFKPVAGQAILWSSVKDKNNKFTRDDLTNHRANPPGKGELKFAMNVWVHARDFDTPNIWGCTVSVLNTYRYIKITNK